MPINTSKNLHKNKSSNQTNSKAEQDLLFIDFLQLWLHIQYLFMDFPSTRLSGLLLHTRHLFNIYHTPRGELHALASCSASIYQYHHHQQWSYCTGDPKDQWLQSLTENQTPTVSEYLPSFPVLLSVDIDCWCSCHSSVGIMVIRAWERDMCWTVFWRGAEGILPPSCPSSSKEKKFKLS